MPTRPVKPNQKVPEAVDLYAPGKDIAHHREQDASPRNGAATDAAFTATRLGQHLMGLRADGSPASRLIADFLLRHPVRVSAWSIEDMAREAGTSPASLSRFARAAGFDGYASLRNAVAGTLETVLQPVAKLRDSFERPAGASGNPGDDLLVEGLHTSLDHVRGLATALDPLHVAALAVRLNAARTIYVMGFGLSAHLAGILSLGLQPFCQQVINVVEFGGTEVAAGRLMNIGAGDVLIVISLPRYAGDAIQLASYARARDAYVVALTDGPLSPLADVADEVIPAPCAHPVLSSSLLAPLAAIEVLITAMMVSNRDNIVKAAKLTEAISAHLYDGRNPSRSSKSRGRSQ